MINKISKGPMEFSALTETHAKELMRDGATILVIRTDDVRQWVTFRCHYFRDEFRGIEYSRMQFEYPLVDDSRLPPNGSTTLAGWWGFFHQPTRISPYPCTQKLCTKYIAIYPEVSLNTSSALGVAPISRLIVK